MRLIDSSPFFDRAQFSGVMHRASDLADDFAVRNDNYQDSAADEAVGQQEAKTAIRTAQMAVDYAGPDVSSDGISAAVAGISQLTTALGAAPFHDMDPRKQPSDDNHPYYVAYDAVKSFQLAADSA